MSMHPMWKMCLKCGKRWDYNPSVGQTRCPYCTNKKIDTAKKIVEVFKSKKEK